MADELAPRPHSEPSAAAPPTAFSAESTLVPSEQTKLEDPLQPVRPEVVRRSLDGRPMALDEGQQGAFKGQTWGDFEIGDLIGWGGMGAVYRARQISLDRPVAIKVLAKHLSDHADFKARFLREARAVAQINSPHVVQVHSAGIYQGHHFFVMELIDGQDLSRLVRDGFHPSNAQAFDLVLQAARGLAAAGRLGIVHRDIKPANMLLTPDRLLKLTDFGLVKMVADDQDENQASGAGRTATGIIIGTASYFSPEQGLGERCDQRTDLYALGVVAYELYTGRLPFMAAQTTSVIYQHVHEPPQPPRTYNQTMHPELQALILKCLQKKPEARFQTADELVLELERLAMAGRISDRGQHVSLHWAVAAGLLVAAIIAVTAVGMTLGRPHHPDPALEAQAENIAPLPAPSTEGHDRPAGAGVSLGAAPAGLAPEASSGVPNAPTPASTPIAGAPRAGPDVIAVAPTARSLGTQSLPSASPATPTAVPGRSDGPADRLTASVMAAAASAAAEPSASSSPDRSLPGHHAPAFAPLPSQLADPEPPAPSVAERPRLAEAGRSRPVLAPAGVPFGPGPDRLTAGSARTPVATRVQPAAAPLAPAASSAPGREVDPASSGAIPASHDATAIIVTRPLRPIHSPGPVWPQDGFGRYADVQVMNLAIRFRWCPAGRFLMGSPEDEPHRGKDERQHEVVLSHGFWIADSECSQGLWTTITGSDPAADQDVEQPVEQVSWLDVQDFISRINQLTPGLQARLPTEAEWEYAARAGSTEAVNQPLERIAWFSDTAQRHTHPSRLREANGWGLCDCLGNVAEWCADCYAAYPEESTVDPALRILGAPNIRGGSFRDGEADCRLAHRAHARASYRSPRVGFRLAASAIPAPIPPSH